MAFRILSRNFLGLSTFSLQFTNSTRFSGNNVLFASSVLHSNTIHDLVAPYSIDFMGFSAIDLLELFTNLRIELGDQCIEILLDFLQLHSQWHIRNNHHEWIVFIDGIFLLDKLRQIRILEYF